MPGEGTPISTRTYAIRDSATMLRRNLVRAVRYPVASATTIAIPVLFLLLFAGVFGKSLGAGLGTPQGGIDYIDYVTPAIILMAAAIGGTSTSTTVSVDMAEGIINRFRTMAISRASVLTGHVVGSVLQTLVSIGLVIGVALLMGFRPTANAVEWVAAISLLALLALALTWPSAAAGLVARGPETASNLSLPFIFLPMLGSGFVPTESMPAGLRWFAEHQPFTPVVDALRGLLIGDPIGNNAVIAIAWCAGIALAGYLWARTAFNRDPKPS